MSHGETPGSPQGRSRLNLVQADLVQADLIFFWRGVSLLFAVLYHCVMRPTAISVPRLDLNGGPLRLGTWHVRAGQLVGEGDRLVEIVAAEVVVELASPAEGVLRKFAAEDDILRVGQIIGEIVN